MNRIAAGLVCAAALVPVGACGDDPPPPTVIEHGRLTLELGSEPAHLAVKLDGVTAWQTAEGAFGSAGSLVVDSEMSFGSFKLQRHPASEAGHAIDRLRDVAATPGGATFSLCDGDTRLGTGEVILDDTLHVRVVLTTNAQRVDLGAALDASEHVVGLGGQSFAIDHNGEDVPLWVQEDGIGKTTNADTDYVGPWFLEGRVHSTHTPMPMALSSRGYAFAIDTYAHAQVDLGVGAAGVARLEVWDGTLDVNVFLGDGARPADAQRQLIAWTGKPERPPLAVFAPWIDALLGSANVRAVAQQVRDTGVAASAIWTEDWRGGMETALTGYALDEDWRVDRELYPDFEGLATDLRARGMQFLTYHNTFIDDTADVHAESVAGGYAIKDATGAPYTFTGVKFSGSTLLDLSNPAAVTWGKRVMSEARTVGSDGWMADFAEWLPTDAVLASGESALAVHNRYPVDWARFNHELFSDRISGRPDPIYFMRSAWLHSQPVTQVMWAGDQQTDWSEGDGLPSVIPIGLGLGLAGFPYFGSDIGGYMSQGTVPTSEELFYRWTTLGALSPVMRTHHGRQIHDNVQWNHDAGTIAHFRRWSRLHTQLAAYFWGSIGSFEADGRPLFRLIALDYPGEDWAWTAVDEYLLGDRILVAPVQTQGATSRALRLPAGEWYPLLGGAAVHGGAITAVAAKTEIPAFVPAGSALVLYPDGTTTVLPAPGAAREVWLYPGVASTPALGTWNDQTGATGTAQWTWGGRPAGAGLPTSATFGGATVPVTASTDGETATITVTGDGTLALPGGGSLVIARGAGAARTVVKLHR